MQRTRALALVAAMVFATACGGSDAKAAGGNLPATSAASAGSARLAFTATTLDDAAFDGAALAGKDAVLWFWAPWCSECRREAPHVAAAQAAGGDSVTFVGVAGRAEAKEMRGFVADYSVGAFPHVVDKDGSIWQRFGVTQQPAYAFIDDSGRVEVIRGAMGAERLTAKVKALTGK